MRSGSRPARTLTDRLVAAAALCSLAVIGFGLLGATAALGAACWAVLTLCLAVGYGDQARRRAVQASIAAIFVLLSLLVWAVTALEAPSGELTLWLGFPPGTAVLVYLIWPLGALPGVLYLLEFDRSTLPEERLERFRREFVRNK